MELPAGRRLLRGLAAWTFGFVLAGALYLLLIDVTDLPELIVGAVAAAIAATGFLLAREQYLVADTVRLAWLARAYRPLLRVPADVWQLTRVALAQTIHPLPRRGAFQAVAFTGGEDEAHAAGRRALAESLGSFAPNTIVFGVDAEREILLAHRLCDRGDPPASIDPLELG